MRTDDLKGFKSRVKKRLKEQGLTQKAFEEQHDLASGTLTRVFGGRKDLDDETLGQIAKGLGVSPESLTGNAEAPKPEKKAEAPKPEKKAEAPKPEKKAEAPKAAPPPREADDEDTVRVTAQQGGFLAGVPVLGKLIQGLTGLFRR